MHPHPTHSRALILGHDPLSITDVVRVARDQAPVRPLPDSAPPGTELADRIDRVERSAAWVRRTMDEIERTNGHAPLVIYGVNTGFGDNAGRAVFRHQSEAAQLSRNLLLSHAIGTGPHLPPDVVRAAMLIRAHTLAQGYSGVRREVINTLVEMLNHDVLPAMPAQGSLGASGDLAPLAHLALVLSAPVPGETPHPGANGQAYHDGALMDGAAAMEAAADSPRAARRKGGGRADQRHLGHLWDRRAGMARRLPDARRLGDRAAADAGSHARLPGRGPAPSARRARPRRTGAGQRVSLPDARRQHAHARRCGGRSRPDRRGRPRIRTVCAQPPW